MAGVASLRSVDYAISQTDHSPFIPKLRDSKSVNMSKKLTDSFVQSRCNSSYAASPLPWD